MPREKTITIDIDAEGNIEVEAEGFQGRACSTEIGKLLAKVGKATERRKADFYKPEEARTERKVGR